jgi:hypothetical protein
VCRDLRAPELVWAGMVTRTAECACGQLRAEADGEPIRVSVCHCLACQRRTGSAFGAQARFARDRVRVSGEAREFVRFADDDGASRTFSFCPQCGSTVFYVLGPEPDVVAIPVGAFADPGFPAPTRSVYDASRRHPWVALPDALERLG